MDMEWCHRIVTLIMALLEYTVKVTYATLYLVESPNKGHVGDNFILYRGVALF